MSASPLKSRSERAAALVVVLLFVVLLSMVTLAFFLKATAFRDLSQSAVHGFQADTLGRSALAMVVADLRQEIANGSTAVPVVGGGELFYPKSPADNVPRRSGAPALRPDGIDPVPNLIRRSVRADGIPPPGVPSRASASSSLDPSRNGRFFSAARWNSHYLIPRDPSKYGGTNSSVVGTDPVAEFVAPDWVYLTDKGPEVLNAGERSVIGRYAYAIYDEGGLLDINVAGHPGSMPLKMPDSSGTAGAVWGSGNKGATAAADLTVLGLSQTQIDQIVGWRTYASSRPAGVFPGLSFDQEAAMRYFQSVHPHEKGFVSVASAQVTAGGQTQTDQIFTSRQQLLKFRSRVGFPQDALQYLGTFSRDVDRPAFVPNPNRPRVQSAAGTNAASYGTGNDAFGVDREADPAADINPPFPQVRVQTAFTRRDGTAATVGEPLVAKRFSLSRLGQILRTATAQRDPGDPIYRDFGLFRSSPGAPWQYDHGQANGILRLEDVAAAGREPDFFELLKAAINVGSLGKSAAFPGWNTDPTADSYLQHHGHDTLVSLQVLQIGANIIDQSDRDGYPTRIAFAGATDKEVRGVESLPYLNRIRMRYVQMKEVPASGSEPAEKPAALLLNPEVWNPHGTPPTGDFPKRFRIRAENTLGPAMPTSLTLVYIHGSAPAKTLEKVIDWTSAGALEFQWTTGTEFNEPSVLVKAGVPAGTTLTGPIRTDNLATPPEDVTGLVLADFDRLHPDDPAFGLDKGYSGLPDYGPITIFLEYWDGSAYRTYDQQIIRYRWRNGTEWASMSFTPKGWWGNYSAKIKYHGFVRTDPRTSRWGTASTELLYLVEPVDLANMQFGSGWPAVTQPPYAPKMNHPEDAGFVNPIAGYPNNDNGPNFESRHRGFAQGYWSQNTVQDQPGFFGVADKPFYNRDPDGIARRAMGAYASETTSGGSASNTMGLPLVTGNAASRPIVLNRPFRSVAELGYTFRDSPWKNLDFCFPESADAALLDVFCIDEIPTDDALVAGRVNLNTRQAPVLQALLAGAITDDTAASPGSLDAATAKAIATALVQRTTSSDPGKGPLVSRSDLVGRWSGTGTAPETSPSPDPDATHSGFSLDLGGVAGINGTALAFIPAQREAAVRALVDAGTTRTWNLFIDLVAQSGKFPSDGAAFDTFQVVGEKRFWLHVAIDRLTGTILDSQLELVTE